jgi:hypothetical protein
LWPASYFCLGCLVWLLHPPDCGERWAIQFWNSLPIAVILVVFLHSPTWARNFIFYDAGRKLFAVGNYDIWPISFFMQEALYFLVNWLLATVWWQWMSYYNGMKEQLRTDSEGAGDARAPNAFDPLELDRLSMVYLHWQIASLFLVGTFIMFTQTYWEVVVVLGDLRYIPHVVFVHAVWAISWAIISLPLIATWYLWKASRDEAVSRIVTAHPVDKEGAELTLKAATELQPIGAINVAATSLVGIFSFVWPYAQAFLRSWGERGT